MSGPTTALLIACALAPAAAAWSTSVASGPPRLEGSVLRHAPVQARAKGKKRLITRRGGDASATADSAVANARPPARTTADGATVRTAAFAPSASMPAAAAAAGRTSLATLGKTWSERELWALEDSVPRYTVHCDRRGPLVLWRRMQVDVPELVGRSLDELRARWLSEHAAGSVEAQAARAESPPCLEGWERLTDSSYRGQLTSVAGVRGGLLATIAVDPSSPLASRAEAELWCVRSISGDLFELGARPRHVPASARACS